MKNCRSSDTFACLPPRSPRGPISATQPPENDRWDGGFAGGGGRIRTSKHYFKGQKMKTETGDTSTILDFDAQTITTVNNRQKTVTVRSFSDMGAARGDVNAVQIDVKETGQQKTDQRL